MKNGMKYNQNFNRMKKDIVRVLTISLFVE